MTAKPKKPCFFIAPIGEPGSNTRKHSDEVLERVVRQATDECGYDVTRGDELPQPGIITSEVIERIAQDPLVIVDLTGGNPNVFYELALRHAARKPCILIVARGNLSMPKGWKIPFNVHALRVIEFDLRNTNEVRKAVARIVNQIRAIESQLTPIDTPVSITGLDLSAHVFDSDNAQGQSPPQSALTSPVYLKVLQDALEVLPTGEAMPVVFKYIAESLKEHHVHLLKDARDDLDAAVSLVQDVPEGGWIYATSSLQSEDADEQKSYRTEVNNALERGVRYCKVICFSSDLNKDRDQKWIEEFTVKAKLIEEGTIDPDAFELLHHPAPMSLDVVISQDADGKCLDMVAGFAGVAGHGGFRTPDQEMVKDFLERYLKGKVIAEAKKHAEEVEAGTECPCSKFLNLLEEARRRARERNPANQKEHSQQATKERKPKKHSS